jgi:hypothetical protein
MAVLGGNAITIVMLASYDHKLRMRTSLANITADDTSQSSFI